MPELKLELLFGEGELDRPVRSVMTTDLADPSRYLTGGELVLTGMLWRREAADSARFVQTVASKGIAALAAGDSVTGQIPVDLVEACQAAKIPLLRVPSEVAFADVTEQVVRRLSGALASDVTQFLGRHRDLVTAGTDGLTAVLDLVREQLSMRCWVMSATGRMVATNGPELSAEVRHQALKHYLSGKRIPCSLAGGAYSVVGVGEPGQPRASNWLMICDSDVADWEVEQHRLARELTALIAAERSRIDAFRSQKRPAVDQLVGMIAADEEPAQLTHQLRLAGLPTDGTFVAVAANIHGHNDLAHSLLEELLYSCGCAATGSLDGVAVAIVPSTPAEVRSAIDLAHGLASALERFPLRLGVSGPAIGVPGLRGALDEARHACTLATMSQDRVSVIGHEDLSSHMMLLAAVPDDVRRAYRQRLLGPLVEYDKQHRADLVPTLRAFLAHSGSWTNCAEVLHIHVNTLRYRIQRIEQLTSRDLGKLEHRVDLFLALTLSGKS